MATVAVNALTNRGEYRSPLALGLSRRRGTSGRYREIDIESVATIIELVRDASVDRSATEFQLAPPSSPRSVSVGYRVSAAPQGESQKFH